MSTDLTIHNEQQLHELLFSFSEQEIQLNSQTQVYHSIVNQLSRYLNELIERDFNRLVNILYRLDIDETRLRSALRDVQPGESSTGKMLAEMIISRQLKKIRTRREYKNRKTSGQ